MVRVQANFLQATMYLLTSVGHGILEAGAQLGIGFLLLDGHIRSSFHKGPICFFEIFVAVFDN